MSNSPAPPADRHKLKRAADLLEQLITDLKADQLNSQTLLGHAEDTLAEVTALLKPGTCGRLRLRELHCYLPDGHGGPHVALTAPVDGPDQAFWVDGVPCASRYQTDVFGLVARCRREAGHSGVHTSAMRDWQWFTSEQVPVEDIVPEATR